MFIGKQLDNAFTLQIEGSESFVLPSAFNIHVWGKVYNGLALGFEVGSTLAASLANWFLDHGPSGFSRLDGCFTCLIEMPDELYVFRDAHGTGQQVYYSETSLASSLWELTRMDGFDAKPDLHALTAFLGRGYIATPQSSFQGIKKLGAGCYVHFRLGRKPVLHQPEPLSVLALSASEAEVVSQYESLHAQAIRRRIEGAESVGILLSGGYDSGSNLLALRRQYAGNIHSFSIGFKGDNWSELPLAACLSDTYSTHHHSYELDGSELDDLPAIVKHLGDPFVEGGVMVNQAVMKLASKDQQPVLLGGDGNDQLFGTTGREIALYLLIKRLGLRPAAQLLNRMLTQARYDQNNRLYKVKFHTDKVLNLLVGDVFGLPDFRIKSLLNDSSLLVPDIQQRLDDLSFELAFKQHAECADWGKTINQVILFKASRLAELHGQHLAYPYMDLDIQRFIMSLPLTYRWKSVGLINSAKGRGESKSLLKRCYRSSLPDVITQRKKQGGFAPMPLFFEDQKRFEKVRTTILESDLCNEVLNRKAVTAFLDTYLIESRDKTGWFWYRQNKAIQVFNLYTLALWWNQFVSQSSR